MSKVNSKQQQDFKKKKDDFLGRKCGPNTNKKFGKSVSFWLYFLPKRSNSALKVVKSGSKIFTQQKVPYVLFP